MSQIEEQSAIDIRAMKFQLWVVVAVEAVLLAALWLDVQNGWGWMSMVTPVVLAALFFWVLRQKRTVVVGLLVATASVWLLLSWLFYQLSQMRFEEPAPEPVPLALWLASTITFWGLVAMLALPAWFDRPNARRCGAWLGTAFGLLAVPSALLLTPTDGFEVPGIGWVALLPLLAVSTVTGAVVGGLHAALETDKARLTLRRFVMALFILAALLLLPLGRCIWWHLSETQQLSTRRDVRGILYKIATLREPYQRGEAAQALAKLDLPAALMHKSKDVRYVAAVYLAEKGDKNAKPILLQALSEGWPKREEREIVHPTVAIALAHLGDARALPYLVAQLKTDKWWHESEETVKAIACFPGKTARDALRQALTNPEPAVSWYAALQLGIWEDPAALPVLAKFLADGGKDGRTRRHQNDAASALANIPGAEAEALLRQAVKSPTDASAKKPSKP
jgi:HEAT repeat protein